MDNFDLATKELENQEIKNRLKFFKTEFENMQKTENSDLTIKVIGKLIDFIEKLALSYRDKGLLTAEINYLTDTIFTLLSSDTKLNEKKQQTLVKAYKKLIDTLDLHIRSPDQISFKNQQKNLGDSKLEKKTFLDKLFRNKPDALESLENKQYLIQTSTLKIDADLLINKFEECLETLAKLNNTDIFRLLPSNMTTPDEFRLLDISKRIRNLLKNGFIDGKKRGEEFTIEGRKYYNRLTSQVKPYASSTSSNESIYLQHVLWHKIKVKEFLDEVKLIKEATEIASKKNNYEKNEIIKYLDPDIHVDPLFKKLISEINKCYSMEMYGLAVERIRKLFENLIIDILKKKYQNDTSTYKGTKDKHLPFHIIIKNISEKIEQGNFNHVKAELTESLTWSGRLRNEGSKSTHSITFDTDKEYLDEIKPKVVRNTELLIRVLNLIK